jgi:hypothetical protein
MFVEIGLTLNFSLAMEVDEIEAGLLEKFSSLQTVDQPGESVLHFLIRLPKGS